MRPDTKTLGYYPGLPAAARGLFNAVAKEETPGIATYDEMVNVIDKAIARVESIGRSLRDGGPSPELVESVAAKLDNLHQSLQMPLPAEMHVSAMKDTLPAIRDELLGNLKEHPKCEKTK